MAKRKSKAARKAEAAKKAAAAKKKPPVSSPGTKPCPYCGKGKLKTKQHPVMKHMLIVECPTHGPGHVAK